MLFSKEKAELLSKIEGLEASLAEVNQSLALANADLTTVREQLATAESQITTLKAEHETALKAKDDEVEAKVNLAVIDAMAAIGVPQDRLPAQGKKPGEGGSASSYAEAMDHYNSLTDATQKAEYYAATIAPFFNRN